VVQWPRRRRPQAVAASWLMSLSPRTPLPTASSRTSGRDSAGRGADRGPGRGETRWPGTSAEHHPPKAVAHFGRHTCSCRSGGRRRARPCGGRGPPTMAARQRCNGHEPATTTHSSRPGLGSRGCPFYQRSAVVVPRLRSHPPPFAHNSPVRPRSHLPSHAGRWRVVGRPVRRGDRRVPSQRRPAAPGNER